MVNRWRDPKTVDRLCELIEAGKSGHQIAMELGMTRNQIIGKTFRLGLSLKGRSGQRPNGPRKKPEPRTRSRFALDQQQLAAIRRREMEWKTMTRDAKDFDATVREVSTIRAGECKYPFNDVGDPNFRFCKEPTDGLASYCHEHHQLCHSHTPSMRPGKERRFP